MKRFFFKDQSNLFVLMLMTEICLPWPTHSTKVAVLEFWRGIISEWWHWEQRTESEGELKTVSRAPAGVDLWAEESWAPFREVHGPLISLHPPSTYSVLTFTPSKLHGLISHLTALNRPTWHSPMLLKIPADVVDGRAYRSPSFLWDIEAQLFGI